MRLLYLAFILLSSIACFSQNDPQEITPVILKKILAEADKETEDFRKSMKTAEMTPDEIEYEIETFRLNLIMEKKLAIDFTTYGMNKAVSERADGYDKLMNKYYNKLVKLLSAEDKKTMINAQKAWLAFRDAEEELIGMMMKEEYSGGGTIQSNIATHNYTEIIIKRTDDIFNYYIIIIKSRQP